MIINKSEIETTLDKGFNLDEIERYSSKNLIQKIIKIEEIDDYFNKYHVINMKKIVSDYYMYVEYFNYFKPETFNLKGKRLVLTYYPFFKNEKEEHKQFVLFENLNQAKEKILEKLKEKELLPKIEQFIISKVMYEDRGIQIYLEFNQEVVLNNKQEYYLDLNFDNKILRGIYKILRRKKENYLNYINIYTDYITDPLLTLKKQNNNIYNENQFTTTLLYEFKNFKPKDLLKYNTNIQSKTLILIYKKDEKHKGFNEKFMNEIQDQLKLFGQYYTCREIIMEGEDYFNIYLHSKDNNNIKNFTFNIDDITYRPHQSLDPSNLNDIKWFKIFNYPYLSENLLFVTYCINFSINKKRLVECKLLDDPFFIEIEIYKSFYELGNEPFLKEISQIIADFYKK